MQLTDYHAKYFAHDLTRRAASGMDRLSMALFDAAVDLNPHQIEAALFALQSPLSKGVILADEVGLGKTIEAGIVLCQFWAERKRRLLVISPASIRKQWALELEEKFNLPAQVLDAKAHREARRNGQAPLSTKAIVVMSHHYANSLREELKAIAWDLVVIDEAHKLRNAYRPSNKVGQGIRWATEDCRKLLLTATPLQNSLVELYGLSTLIDERLFGDANSFRSQYAGAGSNLEALRQRLAVFCKRTLRNQVTEYIRYTERRAITRPFRPTDDEHALYESVSGFLQRENSYALPQRQRHLTALILRKLLASSSQAIAATLDTLRARLETLRDEKARSDPELAERLIEAEEIEHDLLDEILADDEDADQPEAPPVAIDRQKLREEIDILQRLATWARSIGIDTKTQTLLKALEIGFVQMATTGAARKALIFTESRRTQEYLKDFLESHGYRGQVVLFNGTNGGTEATGIYERWVEKNRDTGRASGSRAVDVRTALIEHFRDEATILLATEAAAEGINLQFCSLVVNYDLPWNPQRIEQRIGRCHRYGQKHDVVVINFLNERNEADRRVLELLTEKFSLFNGVFGASDDVLGSIESGVDFEKRILAIYQECRTPKEIDAAFRTLQVEMDEQIRTRLDDTRRKLFEHFDEDVHQRLRIQLADAQAQLDRVGRRFWSLTRFMLEGRARFDDAALAFDLDRPPLTDIPKGRYHLISKSHPRAGKDGGEAKSLFLYRLSHPLGEHVVDGAKALPTPPERIVFDVTNHPTRLHVIEALRGKVGYLILTRLTIDTYEREEYLLFSGFDEAGGSLDQETMERLFGCAGRITNDRGSEGVIPAAVMQRLDGEVRRHAQATVSRSLELNSNHFNEAREKLEKWADDMVLSAEKALQDTKEQVKALRRQARQAVTLAEQHEIQEKIQKLERQQRRLEVLTYRKTHVVAVQVHPSGLRPHHLIKAGAVSGTYVRVGSTNRRADEALIAEMQRFARGEAFDERAMPGLDSEAVSFRAASESFAAVRRLGKRDLETLRLVTEYHGRRVPTAAGVILFGVDRLRHFPDAWIQVGRFEGTNRSTIADHAELKGPLLRSIEETIAFVEKHSTRGVRIGRLRRSERWSLPPVAVREAVINAVAHADYAQGGAPIRVALFADRLEVENPGLLPFGLTVADLPLGVSKLRNRVIGRVLHELGLVEQWGSGIQRMAAACRDAGLATPVFEEIGLRFRVTLRTERERAPKLDALDRDIVSLVHAPDGLATREIAEKIGLTPRATRTRLAALVARGLVREVGTGPQDPKRRYFSTGAS